MAVHVGNGKRAVNHEPRVRALQRCQAQARQKNAQIWQRRGMSRVQLSCGQCGTARSLVRPFLQCAVTFNLWSINGSSVWCARVCFVASANKRRPNVQNEKIHARYAW